jgi:hypothetical protein
MKLLILLLRPDIYDAMEKKSDSPEIEMVGIEEVVDQYGRTQTTLDQETFKSLVKQKTERIGDIQVVQRWSEGQEIDLNSSAYTSNPISVERT